MAVKLMNSLNLEVVHILNTIIYMIVNNIFKFHSAKYQLQLINIIPNEITRRIINDPSNSKICY